ncbi:MAG: 50S ribosomal protein L30 [Flavobacteriia bacterium]|nr:50S ribosomal protein L30 [Flavobacteriia bacterium]OIP46681.1 MAG: 50S ribosomal protein L30 [Flavobacteriaceae bacterium CG2_30_31_66]PIV97918.1 MAG: 50S ribosomal protein L30 [Flavobacteriaceae bacterium CG17_big_fil_post_rev_8_21_14_2_50_31_13]PIX11693.1 MAG: 50S ribosomal protein L30 [Flavobacteriaceae bacterium CG_4_8_14_3_um_filter_31_8]PIY16193.1 MAG: 50S ribosomal protein L30 [Flavobacteriaceae bacterium CG_4_10_14_3_um_filter_31_253]PIZ11254.1 MAG: 50S ribosomal protein L30 [Flavo
MTKIKVTQTKSQIRRPKDQKRTLESLGLRRISQTVVHDSSPTILGMVNKVSHLVSVEELK